MMPRIDFPLRHFAFVLDVCRFAEGKKDAVAVVRLCWIAYLFISFAVSENPNCETERK